MTDQSKISPPGKSLFERAVGSLEKSRLLTAPVPKNLARPANQDLVRKRRKAAAQQRAQEAADQESAKLAAQVPPQPVQQAAPQTVQGEQLAPAAPLTPLQQQIAQQQAQSQAVAGSQAPVVAPTPTAAPTRGAPVQPDRRKSAPSKPSARPLKLSDEVHQISRSALVRNGLIIPEAQVTGLLEEFRIIKRQVIGAVRKGLEAGDGSFAQRILITSPLPDEGKTFCATNLAISLAAEKDSEVLLVDADFAKPSVLSTFGLPAGPGLMDVLANPKVELEDCILKTDISGLYVLPAGNQTNSDSEFLASSRTDEVLARLTAGAPNRIVIFDSPPTLAASPAAELAGHVGQSIVVARADRTGQSALEDALTLLSSCPDIKLLLNAAHFSPSGRRFGAYYGQEA